MYIDDIVIKSAGLDHHLADLRLTLERMRQYGLKMNPLKYAFSVSAEKGIEIDPKRIEAMKKVEAPTCKKDLQKFLDKVNFLWPFQDWELDFIGQINPPSLKGHRFVLVATDYFTKWTEAVSLKNMTHKEVIEFITEHIIHRFGILQTLITDQGSSFISKEVRAFVESYKIKLLNSSPYYAQT